MTTLDPTRLTFVSCSGIPCGLGRRGGEESAKRMIPTSLLPSLVYRNLRERERERDREREREREIFLTMKEWEKTYKSRGGEAVTKNRIDNQEVR